MDRMVTVQYFVHKKPHGQSFQVPQAPNVGATVEIDGVRYEVQNVVLAHFTDSPGVTSNVYLQASDYDIGNSVF